MSDADNDFGGSLGLHFRKWWRHVQPKNRLTSFFNLRQLTSLFTRKTLDPFLYFFFISNKLLNPKWNYFLTSWNLLAPSFQYSMKSDAREHAHYYLKKPLTKGTTGVKFLGFLFMNFPNTNSFTAILAEMKDLFKDINLINQRNWMTLLQKAVVLTLFLKITKSCVVCINTYMIDENTKALCKRTRL